MKTSLIVLALALTPMISNANQSKIKEQTLPFKVTDRSELLPRHEGNQFDDDYMTIKAVKIKELPNVGPVFTQSPNYKSLGATIATANQLIAFGQKVWKIVEKGRPVVSAKFMKGVSVLPNTANPRSSFDEMDSWQTPRTRNFEVTYENLLGMDVVKFHYAVNFEYGGQYKGKGRYLTGVRIAAQLVDVMWGFEFNASSEVLSITNRGTAQNPIAAVTLKVNYQAKSILKDITSEKTFYVTGTGKYVSL